MIDDPFERLLGYDGRRYWLENGWSLRFKVARARATRERPHGIKYAFTLHDEGGARLLGFDNAHGLPRVLHYDHRHRFRRTHELVPYEFVDADQLIFDFFQDVEGACAREGVAFDFVHEDLLEDDDEADESRDLT